jgi:FAD/FMN-containing dehydrogenase
MLSADGAAKLPPWTVMLGLRGFEKAEIAYKKNDLSAIAKKMKDELLPSLKGVKNAGDVVLDEINMPGGPSIHQQEGRGWVPVVTVATAAQIQKCSALFPKNSGALLMPLQAGGCFYYQPDLRYPMGDVKETRKKYAAICATLLKAGVIFPRPSTLIAKQVAAAYPDYFKLLRSIKKAVDPNNIMNPGKLGL